MTIQTENKKKSNENVREKGTNLNKARMDEK
jgi:hypothetical protein